MDKQYLIRDDHIGVFKNFMSNELIEDYLNYFNKLIILNYIIHPVI